MLGAASRLTLVLLMLSGWVLLLLAGLDYLLGNLLGLFATANDTQVWGVFLGFTLSLYPTFYWQKNPFKLWWRKLKKSSAPPGLIGLIGQLAKSAVSLLRFVYTHLYQIADVLFCIGLPMPVVTAFVGWWLLDEVSLTSMVLYLCLLLAISIIGIYSNAVRMLSLGYFAGYWIIVPDWLSYPFAAPMRVQQNIDVMITQSGIGLLWALGVICLLLYLARSAATSLHDMGVIQEHFVKRSIAVMERKLEGSKFADRFFFAALILGFPAAFLSLNSLIDQFNIHLVFAATVIILMDINWKMAMDNEPTLSGDVQYLLSRLWWRK